MSNKVEFNLDYIIEEYSSYIYTVVENIVGASLPKEDKEEIVSDSFYLLWKFQSKINTNLKAYLSAIARNCALSRLRKTSINYNYDDNYEIGYTIDFDNILIIKEKLKKLTTEEQKIFEYYYTLGLKINEISKKLNKTNSYIKIKLYRIRKKLKEELNNEWKWYQKNKRIN